jgi:hypothetical protein
MESYRIYKALPVDAFMEETSFVVAKVGLLLTPVIQDINYYRHRFPLEHCAREIFMKRVRKAVVEAEEHLNRELQILDMGQYFFLMPFEKKTCSFQIPAEVEQQADTLLASLSERYEKETGKSLSHRECESIWWSICGVITRNGLSDAQAYVDEVIFQ